MGYKSFKFGAVGKCFKSDCINYNLLCNKCRQFDHYVNKKMANAQRCADPYLETWYDLHYKERHEV